MLSSYIYWACFWVLALILCVCMWRWVPSHLLEFEYFDDNDWSRRNIPQKTFSPEVAFCVKHTLCVLVLWITLVNLKAVINNIVNNPYDFEFSATHFPLDPRVDSCNMAYTKGNCITASSPCDYRSHIAGVMDVEGKKHDMWPGMVGTSTACFSPTFRILSGRCFASGQCVSSPDYPQNYRNNDICDIEILSDGVIYSKKFQTESGCDLVSVSGETYSGKFFPPGVAVRRGTIMSFHADSTITYPGFQICLKFVPCVEGRAPEDCACQPGTRDLIEDIDFFPWKRLKCAPVACPEFSHGINISDGCLCDSGFSGVITPIVYFPYYSGECKPVECPLPSVGNSVPKGCVCKPGHNGSIEASMIAPYYTGQCREVRCPHNSHGNDVASGCVCDTGYAGQIVADASPPFYTGQCISVACADADCPHGSSAISEIECSCKAGYAGANIVRVDGIACFHGKCAIVNCPDNSAGPDVSTGCICNEGFTGSIRASTSPPYYTGSCRPATFESVYWILIFSTLGVFCFLSLTACMHRLCLHSNDAVDLVVIRSEPTTARQPFLDTTASMLEAPAALLEGTKTKEKKRRQESGQVKRTVTGDLCCVCLHASRGAVLTPCGHKAVCEACGGQLMARGDTCPICRASIDGVVRVFEP